jgi:eukaryotic-like serine/threonine-protein kinase
MLHLHTFGKYEILGKLSRSMTDVYLARDTERDRRVMLKLIEHSRDEYTQLVIEAERRGAALQTQLHQIDPRILEVYEYGEQNGCFFLAMEYWEGRTLAHILLAERRMEPRRAARYAAEVCSQLKTLHSFVADVNGRETAVVHGDIKPANVQIGVDDNEVAFEDNTAASNTPKPRTSLRLLDFGIAKVISSTHNLTHHNLGSPTYCSPERISKSQVDQHSDLWAVGVTLYEMLAGAPPYQAQNTRKLEALIQSRRPPRALPPDCPVPLRAIVGKALAADIQRRYQSCEAFAADLQAFLDRRITRAELESKSSWHSNPTVDKAASSAQSRTKAPEKRAVINKFIPRGIAAWASFSNVVALLAGMLVGLLIFIPIAYCYRLSSAAAALRAPKDYAHYNLQSVASDWGIYKELKRKNRLFGTWSPTGPLDSPMHDHLIAAAEDIFDNFRHSTDQQLRDFDWNKARFCVQHALEIDPSDVKAKGELALCNGYFDLTQNPPSTSRSIENFRRAEWYVPRWPDPHLGLARIYVYQLHNIGKALAEFQQAEQLGYKLGPRETEQEADGYLFRAESELARARRLTNEDQNRAKWLQMARDDMGRASSLYEPIAGFSHVSANLEHLRQDRDEETKLQMDNVHLATTRSNYPKHNLSVRRWQ